MSSEIYVIEIKEKFANVFRERKDDLKRSLENMANNIGIITKDLYKDENTEGIAKLLDTMSNLIRNSLHADRRMQQIEKIVGGRLNYQIALQKFYEELAKQSKVKSVSQEKLQNIFRKLHTDLQSTLGDMSHNSRKLLNDIENLAAKMRGQLPPEEAEKMSKVINATKSVEKTLGHGVSNSSYLRSVIILLLLVLVFLVFERLTGVFTKYLSNIFKIMREAIEETNTALTTNSPLTLVIIFKNLLKMLLSPLLAVYKTITDYEDIFIGFINVIICTTLIQFILIGTYKLVYKYHD